jgi:manganese-dependent inorganic pyrophosphatase
MNKSGHGHRNPDTDAICSAIGYAELKCAPAPAPSRRCGDTNDRIDFVLKSFSVLPRVLSPMSRRKFDVMHERHQRFARGIVAEALNIMSESNIRFACSTRPYAGLSPYKTSKFYPGPTFVRSRRVLATLRNLARTLRGKMIFAQTLTAKRISLTMIGAMSLESFPAPVKFASRAINRAGGDRKQIQQLAVQRPGLGNTGGLALEPSIFDQAQRKSRLILPT